MSFTDQVIVITGASDGIGAELARQLARERARLVLGARRLEALETVAGECRALGAQALAVRCDVSVEADCATLIERAVAQYGRIDVLVNNAGVSMHAWFDEITEVSTYERLWRINCLGTVLCTRFAWPHLKQSRGLVVGVSSLAGKIGVPARTVYCASKFAQTGFLDALRVEAADHGIAVTVVYPGVVATEIRRNGLNGRGERAGVSGLEEAQAMPVDECVRQMIAAMRTRKRELVMTTQGKLSQWFKLITPGLIDRMARAALSAQERQAHAGARR